MSRVMAMPVLGSASTFIIDSRRRGQLSEFEVR